MKFDEHFTTLYEQYFSNLYIDKNHLYELSDTVESFMTEIKSYTNNTDVLSLLFEKNRQNCKLYEPHAYCAVEEVADKTLSCFVLSGFDYVNAVATIKKRFPSYQISLTIIDSEFIDNYLKQILLCKLVNSYDSIAFNPEIFRLVKKCIYFEE